MTQTEDEFRLRDIALAAYGPSVANGIGHGAVLPILAIRARDLGADVSTAALVVAVTGIGMLVASLPAGALVARIGERRALLYAGCADTLAMAVAASTHSVAWLVVTTFVSGMTWTVFLLSRQGFMIDAVPLSHRARALSTLGGMHRVGALIGPLLGALVIHAAGLSWVFAMAGCFSLTAGLMTRLMPDLGHERRVEQSTAGHVSVRAVLTRHRRVLLTLGTAVVVISASRSLRTGLLPLWAVHVGLDASTTSLIFAIAAALDIAFFLPGGWLMDHRGRTVVAVPVVAAVAVACLLLPLTSGVVGVTVLTSLIAIGNGLGSGIVMTLGADAAPAIGRAQFLGGWRLCGDIGNTGGPLLVSAVSAVAPLATACIVLGVLGLAGTAWVARCTRPVDRQIRESAPRVA